MRPGSCVLAGGVALAALAGCSSWTRPRPVELERLGREREALQQELQRRLDETSVLDLKNAPAGNVLIGVPTAFTRSLIAQVVAGLLSEVKVTLRDLELHHEDDVRAKVLFTTQTLGHFVLDVDVERIEVLLKPGPPELRFGGNHVEVRLPVTLADGRGRAKVRFQWSGRGIAGTVCGDVDVTQDATSRVLPATYQVAGEFELATEGAAVVARPHFREVSLKLQLDPTPETWKAVAAAVDQVRSDKSSVCAVAIQKLDAAERLKKIIEKGFTVKLPSRLFKPIVLPAGVEESLSLPGRQVSLELAPLGLYMGHGMLWYGANFGALPAPSPASSPLPR